MRAYLCDRCKTLLEDGPLGAFSNVAIEIQPSYQMTETSLQWHLCPTDTKVLMAYLNEFLKESDASQD